MFVTDARCAPDGQHVVIVEGSSFEGGQNDVYLADRAGNVRRLTNDQRTGHAVFAADGRSIIV